MLYRFIILLVKLDEKKYPIFYKKSEIVMLL